MPDQNTMAAAVAAYIEAFRNEDLDAIVALFAEGASVEDPVGSAPQVGLDAIRTFYAKSIEMHAKLEQQGATRLAGDYAAFAFHAVVPGMGHVEVIDTFRFNEAGKVTEMRAFFGPGNVKPLAG